MKRDESAPDVGVDPFFTARVLAALPERPLGAGLSPRRRLGVLVAAYGFAAAIGYAAMTDDESETMSGVAAAVHGVVARADEDPFTRGGAIVLPIALVVVAFVAARTHTEAA